MDTYKPFQEIHFSNVQLFAASRYEEYQSGSLIDSGNTDIRVKLSSEAGEIKCIIGYNNLHDRLSSCSFDRCITLQDRLLLFNNPIETNANIPITAMLSTLMGYTRGAYYYASIEPVVGSIYTRDGNIVKISFTMANPERLVELY